MYVLRLQGTPTANVKLITEDIGLGISVWLRNLEMTGSSMYYLIWSSSNFLVFE